MAKDKNGNSWTVSTLKEYIDLHFGLVDKGLTKSETAMDKRLDRMNEIREQLDDQARTFITKHEVDLRLKTLQEKIEYLQECQNKNVGEKTGKKDMTATILAGIAILGFVINLIIQFAR